MEGTRYESKDTATLTWLRLIDIASLDWLRSTEIESSRLISELVEFFISFSVSLLIEVIGTITIYIYISVIITGRG